MTMNSLFIHFGKSEKMISHDRLPGSDWHRAARATDTDPQATSSSLASVDRQTVQRSAAELGWSEAHLKITVPEVQSERY